jgi:DNA-binding MarR family transcriptional regulator
MSIAKKEGISQKALSEELLIDKTTTAKAIGKLHKMLLQLKPAIE